ncbi:hypothetical protein [Bradyrhizobium sp. ARR65]|uniref:hypothetical protein n=1 Tax=Bradyrhizobium sp. ARR65 TaxID=1040989 RepID=UPI00046368B1|nr:hypothetical protein [Bradyrhizobium sp. ARR65]
MFLPYPSDQTKVLYEALDIATRYLVLRGYDRLGAQEKAARRILTMFNSGEHRPLMLANKAIAAVEKEEAEQPSRSFPQLIC